MNAAAAASILKVKAGAARPAVSNPTVKEAKLRPSDLIAGGAITTTTKAVYIEVVPAAGIQVALEDFESLLLGAGL